MRSPVGELVRAASRALTRPDNKAPVPYTGRAATLARPALFGRGGTQQQLDAMGSVGTLFGIVNRTSNATSQVEWDLWRKAKSGKDEDRTLVTSHLALDIWNKPNNFYTRQLFVETFQQHLDLVGEGWWVVARNPAARSIPLELWPVRPDRMTPIPSHDDYLLGYVYTGPDGEQVPLQLDEVIQLRMPNPSDPYRGMGPVQSILADIDATKYSAEWNRNFFVNSAEPGGIVQVDRRLSDDEFAEMVTRWREQHQGVANAHRVAILEQGEWIDRKYSMRDMQFVELRGVARDVQLEAFGMPKFAIGVIDDVNRATAEAAKTWFAEMLTVPRLERIKGALNAHFLPLFGRTAQGLEFDYRNPVPPDAEAINAERESKASAAKTYVDAGFTGDSTKEALGLPDALVWERPAPAPAPPAGLPGAPGAAPVDRIPPPLTHADPWHQLVGRLLAEATPPDGTPEELPPDEMPDVTPAIAILEAALAALLVAWALHTAAQVAALVAAVRDIVTRGALAELAALTVDTTATTNALADSMVGVADRGASMVADEAATQGVHVAAASVARGDLEPTAQVVAAGLADELRVAASREALRVAGTGAGADEVADAVQVKLDGRSDASERKQLGGALHGAINAGRLATLQSGPVGAIYASEHNDSRVCPPCREINGRWLGNTDDLAPVLALYPAGAYGGYIDCEGGIQCRGTVTGVWRPDQADDGETSQ